MRRLTDWRRVYIIIMALGTSQLISRPTDRNKSKFRSTSPNKNSNYDGMRGARQNSLKKKKNSRAWMRPKKMTPVKRRRKRFRLRSYFGTHGPKIATSCQKTRQNVIFLCWFLDITRIFADISIRSVSSPLGSVKTRFYWSVAEIWKHSMKNCLKVRKLQYFPFFGIAAHQPGSKEIFLNCILFAEEAEKYGWKSIPSYTYSASIDDLAKKSLELDPLSHEGFVVCDSRYIIFHIWKTSKFCHIYMRVK